VNVRITDTQHPADVVMRLCARAGEGSPACRNLRLRQGQHTLRTSVRLARAGRWTVSLRSPGRLVARHVDVRAGERYEVLVTGDSMVFGVLDVVRRSVRATGGTLHGDPNPGSGITKPTIVDWPVHARATVRKIHEDATVVFLGAANDTFPVTTASGASADCCTPEWVAEYVRRVRAMMATYLRGGNALVYWVLLPIARDPARTASIHAINGAIAQAAATFPDGVRLVDIAPAITPHGQYTDTIMYHGKRVVIRQGDGMHLANAGDHVVAQIILRAMRADGLVRR
jgi:hypothetical protein